MVLVVCAVHAPTDGTHHLLTHTMHTHSLTYPLSKSVHTLLEHLILLWRDATDLLCWNKLSHHCSRCLLQFFHCKYFLDIIRELYIVNKRRIFTGAIPVAASAYTSQVLPVSIAHLSTKAYNSSLVRLNPHRSNALRNDVTEMFPDLSLS